MGHKLKLTKSSRASDSDEMSAPRSAILSTKKWIFSQVLRKQQDKQIGGGIKNDNYLN